MCSLSKGNILLALSSNEFLQFFLSWFSLILLCNFAFTLPGGTIWHSDISLIRTEYYFQSRPKIVFSHKPTRLRQFMSHQHVIECNIHPIWTTFGWKSAANLKLTAHVVQHMFWLMSSIIIKLVNIRSFLHLSFIHHSFPSSNACMTTTVVCSGHWLPLWLVKRVNERNGLSHSQYVEPGYFIHKLWNQWDRYACACSRCVTYKNN